MVNCNMKNDETGAVSVEYSLLAAVFSLGAVSAIAFNGDRLKQVFTSATDAQGEAVSLSDFSKDNILTDSQDGFNFGRSTWIRPRRVGWGYISRGVRGWQVRGGRAQHVRNRYARFRSKSGYWLDMSARRRQNLTLSKKLKMNKGSEYTLSFKTTSYRYTAAMDVYFGGQKVGSTTSARGSLGNHNYKLRAGSGDGSNILTFRETGRADGYGTYLADINVKRSSL